MFDSSLGLQKQTKNVCNNALSVKAAIYSSKTYFVLRLGGKKKFEISEQRFK